MKKVTLLMILLINLFYLTASTIEENKETKSPLEYPDFQYPSTKYSKSESKEVEDTKMDLSDDYSNQDNSEILNFENKDTSAQQKAKDWIKSINFDTRSARDKILLAEYIEDHYLAWIYYINNYRTIPRVDYLPINPGLRISFTNPKETAAFRSNLSSIIRNSIFNLIKLPNFAFKPNIDTNFIYAIITNLRGQA